MSSAVENAVAVKDAQELLELVAIFVRLTAERDAVQASVVTLARRLTQDWRLTDEEAVRLAGPCAFAILARSARGGGGDVR